MMHSSYGSSKTIVAKMRLAFVGDSIERKNIMLCVGVQEVDRLVALVAALERAIAAVRAQGEKVDG